MWLRGWCKGEGRKTKYKSHCEQISLLYCVVSASLSSVREAWRIKIIKKGWKRAGKTLLCKPMGKLPHRLLHCSHTDLINISASAAPSGIFLQNTLSVSILFISTDTVQKYKRRSWRDVCFWRNSSVDGYNDGVKVKSKKKPLFDHQQWFVPTLTMIIGAVGAFLTSLWPLVIWYSVCVLLEVLRMHLEHRWAS